MKRKWLIQFRKSKRLTQEQVASAAFIDRGYYSQIETGKRNPGLNVAINIAKVLDFDPMMFFQDHLNQSLINETISNCSLSEHLKEMDKGEIFYLFNSYDKYLQHVILFLLTGISKGSTCIIIDYRKNFNQILKRIETSLTNKEIYNKIHFFNNEEIMCYEPQQLLEKLQVFQTRIGDKQSIRVWLHEENNSQNNWLKKLENLLKSNDIKQFERNLLFIRSCNASKISALEHIHMMKTYPFLMTDFEIVQSPFYSSSNKSYIFPSLFIQENME